MIMIDISGTIIFLENYIQDYLIMKNESDEFLRGKVLVRSTLRTKKEKKEE